MEKLTAEIWHAVVNKSLKKVFKEHNVGIPDI